MKKTSILRHAMVMVGRTLKSYALLSVTIVMSFSLLLGYLVFTDANLYNEYADLFAYRRGDVLVRHTGDNGEKLSLFLENLDEMDGTQYYIYTYGLGGSLTTEYHADDCGLPEGSEVTLHNWQMIFVPDHAWVEGTMVNFYNDVTWLAEPREDFYLKADEAILCEGVYYALGLDQMEEPVYTFRFEHAATLTLKIVGYTKDEYPLKLVQDEEVATVYSPDIYYTDQIILSSKLENKPFAETYVAIHSENPEQVVKLAESMNFDDVASSYQQQNDALEAIRLEKRNKAIIACALLLLLGINLYSSFTNALNDRKFEIGVKRAIGASSWNIVRQFLYESLMVMTANTFLSVVLVTDVFIVYKYIYERTPDQWGNLNQFIVYISPQSIAMFAVCAVSLTIVFSLIFAYKSTRVEIVQYLKAE